MGDAHGTGVTQRHICAIAKANKACRVPGKGDKKDTLCCDEYDDAIMGVDRKAIPAETVSIAQALTTGPRRTVVFDDTGQLAVLSCVTLNGLGRSPAMERSRGEGSGTRLRVSAAQVIES